MNIIRVLEETAKGQPMDRKFEISVKEMVDIVSAWYVMQEKAEVIRDFYQRKYEGKTDERIAILPPTEIGLVIGEEPEEGTGQSISQTRDNVPANAEMA